MAYIICSNCGAKALSVASRCPSCQHPFPSREERERANAPARKPAPKALWFILGLMALVGAGGWVAWSTKKQADADKLAAAAQLIPAEPVQDTTPKPIVAVGDSVPTALSAQAVPPAMTQAATPATTPTPVTPPNVSNSDTPPPVTAPGPPGPNVVWERAVAITAVNVRQTPDRASKALIVLVPDDVVMLGDAITGWRRIRVDGMNGWVDPRHFAIRPRKR